MDQPQACMMVITITQDTGLVEVIKGGAPVVSLLLLLIRIIVAKILAVDTALASISTRRSLVICRFMSMIRRDTIVLAPTEPYWIQAIVEAPARRPHPRTATHITS